MNRSSFKKVSKKNERTMFVGTKTISIFLCKELKKGVACVLVSQHLSTLAL